jgi:hypothetical protein
MKMRLYYIAYDYGQNIGVEMIDGPYGTASEAFASRTALTRLGGEQENLIIVRKMEEVEKVDL